MKILRSALACLAVACLLVAPTPALGRSLDFDGAGGTVTFAQPTAISGADGLTGMMWVNLDATVVRTWLIIDNSSTTFNFRIDSAVGGGGLEFDHASGGGLASIVAVPRIGEWDHIAFRFDRNLALGSRTVFYINGVLQGPPTTETTTSAVIGNVAANATMTIGASITSTTNGRIAHVRLFRSALSQQQIQAEMLCSRPQNTDLVFWAPFDMGDKTIPDLANGKPGTPTTGISVSDSTPPVELCGAGG